MNQLWTTYHFAREPWVACSMQLLILPSHIKARDMGECAKINN